MTTQKKSTSEQAGCLGCVLYVAALFLAIGFMIWSFEWMVAQWP